MWRIALGLIIGGCVLLGFAWSERNLAAGASTKPEEISLKALLARGPEGNPNIILKDYVIGDNFVYETSSKTSKTYSKVWVPAAPPDEVQVHPDGDIGDITNVRAIIVSTNVRADADVEVHCQKDRLPAMVTNRVTSLGSKEKDLLRKQYPNANLETCLIIEEGREPAGAFKLMALGGGGVLAFLAGIGVFILSFMRGRQQGAAPSPKKRRRLDDDDEEEDDRRSRRHRGPRDEDDK